MPVIEAHIDEFLRNKLKDCNSHDGNVIGEKTITQFKTVFMNELEVIFPEVIDKYAADLMIPGVLMRDRRYACKSTNRI